jgi:tetratricopeptide (TPR) repeat protein
MYKNKFLITSLTVMALSLGSCHDELLNPVPESITTTANAFNLAKDVDLAVLGIYNRLQSRIPTDYELMEIPSDNMFGEYFATAPGMSEINTLDVSPENDKLNSFWKITYNGIFRANTVLANIDKPAEYAAGQKEQYIGEAKFLRALFYFDLVRVFGGVPRVTSIVSIDESREIPRATETEIYNLIEEDLKDAIAKLPPEMDRGRASKAAAIALLGKVYIYLEEYNKARTHLEQLFSEFNYSLVANYEDLFEEATEDNSEAIFSVTYVGGTNGHGLTYSLAPHGGIYQVINNGSRVGRPTWDLQKAFDRDDSRFYTTITEEQLSWASEADDDPIWYPYFSKWIIAAEISNSSGLDIPLLRLGDMILLYAEALYFTNEPELALEQINLIRERAFGDDTHNYTMADIPTEQDFMDKLLLERRLELAVENNRWFDLVRTGRFISKLTVLEGEYNPSTGNAVMIDLNAQPFMKHFPIPYEQIQLAAPGIVKQNEGYN